jgi:hypothetical protein
MYPTILIQKNISPETIIIIDKQYKLFFDNKEHYYNENDEIFVNRNNNKIKIKIKELSECDEIINN